MTVATIALGVVVVALALWFLFGPDDLFYDLTDLDEIGVGRTNPDPHVVHRIELVDDHLGQSWVCTCGLWFWRAGSPDMALAWNRHLGLVGQEVEA